jgi:O-acetyl-ADP-ribose deacetylase (regulator of RNase III)
MQICINQTVIELIQGNIATQTVDALVNEWHSTAVGDGGLDGALRAAGGQNCSPQAAHLARLMLVQRILFQAINSRPVM